jgi:hypothetical protein
MWTAIMIIALNGQPTELRGVQSMDEGACMRAALMWSWTVTRDTPGSRLIDIRCVIETRPR